MSFDVIMMTQTLFNIHNNKVIIIIIINDDSILSLFFHLFLLFIIKPYRVILNVIMTTVRCSQWHGGTAYHFAAEMKKLIN
jgi:hypothetical protein